MGIGVMVCYKRDVHKNQMYNYTFSNKMCMDYPHKALLKICRNHLNNMTIYTNTAISQFGLSIGIEQ